MEHQYVGLDMLSTEELVELRNEISDEVSKRRKMEARNKAIILRNALKEVLESGARVVIYNGEGGVDISKSDEGLKVSVYYEDD